MNSIVQVFIQTYNFKSFNCNNVDNQVTYMIEHCYFLLLRGLLA